MMITEPTADRYICIKKKVVSWVYSKKITPSDGDESDAFGSSLAFNEHGLLVGAYSDDDNGFFSGAVYYFSLKDLNTVSLKSVRVDRRHYGLSDTN